MCPSPDSIFVGGRDRRRLEPVCALDAHGLSYGKTRQLIDPPMAMFGPFRGFVQKRRMGIFRRDYDAGNGRETCQLGTLRERAQLEVLGELPTNHWPTFDQNDDDCGFCSGPVRTVRLARGRDFLAPST